MRVARGARSARSATIHELKGKGTRVTSAFEEERTAGGGSSPPRLTAPSESQRHEHPELAGVSTQGTQALFDLAYAVAMAVTKSRPHSDEIVQIAPNHYLGKLQVRIIPNYPFTLMFFELKK